MIPTTPTDALRDDGTNGALLGRCGWRSEYPLAAPTASPPSFSIGVAGIPNTGTASVGAGLKDACAGMATACTTPSQGVRLA